MSDSIHLSQWLPESTRGSREGLALFVFLNLGIIESLASGRMSATDGVRLFFNAENGLFVRKRFKDKVADRIMSHGAQLPDLFDALSADEAHREFQRELGTMRDLCLKLLDEKKLVA